ncbi:type VI secretion ATPase%2C ClpV1 family protein [Klebsiella michiganensis]|nr:type VI secretion ATPase%2C ClpV1 family protein [Klebsiella michiganensis]
MKTVRPLWGRGQMVSPQHFQQEAAQAAWHTECVARLGAIHPWGVARTAFDAALLKQGKLKADHLCVRFADGTLTDSDNADALPPVMTLPETESHELTVVLALPHEYENGGNCLQPEQKAERPVRWRLAWREVRNRYGDDSRQIAVMQPELTLRTEDNDNGNYQTVAVARLKRDSQGDWSQDASFIPPLLNVQASRWLTEQTEYLTGQLRARLQRLMSMRRESNERMAGEEHIRSIHLLMALVDKQSLVRCDGLWPLLTLAQSQLARLRPLLDAQSEERPEVQQEAELAQGDEVAFVGRPVNAGVKEGDLNPALQNALDKFTLDVTARARDGKIDPVFGRDNEIRQMVDILSRRRKNNPILVGEPGVGKTALVEGLAIRIAEGNVPDALKPVSVRTLDLGLLQAGAGVKGEFEQRLKNIIDAVQQSPLPVLLFIDEAHTLIGAGNQHENQRYLRPYRPRRPL